MSMELADEIDKRVTRQFNEIPKANTLRLSQMGPRCPKALWHSIHTPQEAAPLPPWATFKYTFGDIIEAMAISLAKASGHSVTGEQDELYVDGVKGHRDCVIDGCIVDVKSSSSHLFKKFERKSILEMDSFGYLDQLDGYILGSSNDPLVSVKDRGYLLAIDLQLGHMCLYEHALRERGIRDRIKNAKEIIGRSSPPTCTCKTETGSFGNEQLSTIAGYNPFRYSCNPQLRCFLYSNGPVYITKLVEKPSVPEIDKYGKVIG